ncbi:MAG: hypothetical protein GEV28_37160 [Actinophytocola sp.]|nr:hypothetical protein [Actinophytocola sp.]
MLLAAPVGPTTDLLGHLDRHGVRLRALHEQLDTAEHGEHLLRVIHGLIEARRIFQSEATKDGLAAAVAAGRTPGRRPGSPLPTHEQEELAHQLQATGRSVTEIANLLGVSRAAMYRARSPSRPPTTGEDSAP